jgi:hypothetical protein
MKSILTTVTQKGKDMIRCNQFGQHTRLGNWLFVYAFVVSVAEKTGHEVEMPEGYFLWKYLEQPPKLTTESNYDVLFQAKGPAWSKEWMDEAYQFFASNKNKTINIDLTCFFQSEKWFDPEIVKRKIKIKQECVDAVFEKYSDLAKSQLIGIGIRRGDFVGHGVFCQIPEYWYLRTLNKMMPAWKKNCKVAIFSDDIDWCKRYYAEQPFFYPEPNGTHMHGATYHKDPMEQFILGAHCDYFIGGSSTFSWWQMWYVKNIMNGEVFHCGRNISDDYYQKYGHEDYYPPLWKNCEILL